jgi:cbb3-type cytochrome oxidase maturation protein
VPQCLRGSNDKSHPRPCALSSVTFLAQSIFETSKQFMSVILLLLIASILVAGGFLIAFIYSVKTGQYDDEQSPPMRMLFDNPVLKDDILSKDVILNRRTKVEVCDATKLRKEVKLTNK